MGRGGIPETSAACVAEPAIPPLATGLAAPPLLRNHLTFDFLLTAAARRALNAGLAQKRPPAEQSAHKHGATNLTLKPSSSTPALMAFLASTEDAMHNNLSLATDNLSVPVTPTDQLARRMFDKVPQLR